jgi:hypothetical protein
MPTKKFVYNPSDLEREVDNIKPEVTHLSCKTPTFDLYFERRIVRLVDEDHQSVVIWEWNVDHREAEPTKLLYRNDLDWYPSLVTAHMEKAVETMDEYYKSLEVEL